MGLAPEGWTLEAPLAALVAFTGPTGAQPSRWMDQRLRPALESLLSDEQAAEDRISWPEGHAPARLAVVDERPISNSSRSCPATYIGVFKDIRELFAQTREARVAGYGAGRFSFNADGGRCAACDGAGHVTLDLTLLPDVTATCPSCDGRRYNDATLQVRYRGYSVAQILAMSVDDALTVFERQPRIRGRLEALHKVGLGYLCLGQPATSLSGGEAHRVKLARELAKRSGARTLYLLDAPTAGLHPEDAMRLLSVLHELVEAGHSVWMVSHRIEALGDADHVMELLPGWPVVGLLGSGATEELAARADSPTGRWLVTDAGK